MYVCTVYCHCLCTICTYMYVWAVLDNIFSVRALSFSVSVTYVYIVLCCVLAEANFIEWSESMRPLAFFPYTFKMNRNADRLPPRSIDVDGFCCCCCWCLFSIFSSYLSRNKRIGNVRRTQLEFSCGLINENEISICLYIERVYFTPICPNFWWMCRCHTTFLCLHFQHLDRLCLVCSQTQKILFHRYLNMNTIIRINHTTDFIGPHNTHTHNTIRLWCSLARSCKLFFFFKQ